MMRFGHSSAVRVLAPPLQKLMMEKSSIKPCILHSAFNIFVAVALVNAVLVLANEKRNSSLWALNCDSLCIHKECNSRFMNVNVQN